MTERASPSPESRHAAISWPFGRAMLSLRLLFSVSVLALSGAPRQLSQGESLGQRGQALRDAKASPFGRGGIAQAMTERASSSPESRHAAISWPFGRAMLSLRLLFSVSVLALSGAPRQLSQGESLGQRGQALRDAKASPFGRGGIAQAMTERASPSPESRHAAISRFFERAKI